jgi:hypothetical protein
VNKSKILPITTLGIVVLILVATMVHSESTLGRTLTTALQAGCDSFVTSITGATGAFVVTGSGTPTLGVTSLGDPNCIPLNSVVVGSTNNALVTISPFTPGVDTSVTISASAINPSLPSSFVVSVSNTCHTITINATVQCPAPPAGCTFTQGYWKNHPESWPVSSLTLGTVTYTKAQLIATLKTPVRGNGLISLSYQLIAAKLNQANGASVPPEVASAIAAADALIGGLVVPPAGSGFLSPSATDSLTNTLDTYNNGLAAGGPSHCD